MKKLVLLVVVVLFVTSSVFAGGASCKRGEAAKTVVLEGTISCADGTSGADCARVFTVADSKTQYSICDKSKVKFTSLGNGMVRVSGKLVNCDKGEELVIDKAAKI